jgi:hypothetical protein
VRVDGRAWPDATGASLVKLLAPLMVLTFCGWLMSLDLHRSHGPHHLRQPVFRSRLVAAAGAD